MATYNSELTNALDGLDRYFAEKEGMNNLDRGLSALGGITKEIVRLQDERNRLNLVIAERDREIKKLKESNQFTWDKLQTLHIILTATSIEREIDEATLKNLISIIEKVFNKVKAEGLNK